MAPDGNQTADTIAAVTDTPVIQHQIAGLADGGTYTFYIWARVPSGTRKVSIAIVDNAYAAYLAGPTQITLTTSWQRFKITGTLASGQTGLWIVVRQYAANGDDWTTGDIHLWGACLQHGDNPQKSYARTWASQTPHAASGLATGPTVIAAPDNTTSPLKIQGPGSNLADSTLLELTANGELILAGGTGNGYRFADLGPANNPSGWSGVIGVKTPAGATLGYILLYSPFPSTPSSATPTTTPVLPAPPVPSPGAATPPTPCAGRYRAVPKRNGKSRAARSGPVPPAASEARGVHRFASGACRRQPAPPHPRLRLPLDPHRAPLKPRRPPRH
jgi:hypothetical protein